MSKPCYQVQAPNHTLEDPTEKNSSALSIKLIGNLLCNIKPNEASEAGKLCLTAQSSQVFVPLWSLWLFTLTTLALLPWKPPLPNTTRVFLRIRLDLMGRSPWSFLDSGTNWLPSHGSSAVVLAADGSDWTLTNPCLHDLRRESNISILSSCCTTPLLCSHP